MQKKSYHFFLNKLNQKIIQINIEIMTNRHYTSSFSSTSIKHGSVLRNPNRVLPQFRHQQALTQFQLISFPPENGPQQNSALRNTVDELKGLGAKADRWGMNWSSIWMGISQVRMNNHIMMLAKAENYFVYTFSQENTVNPVRKMDKNEAEIWRGILEIQDCLREDNFIEDGKKQNGPFAGISSLIDAKLGPLCQLGLEKTEKMKKELKKQLKEINFGYSKLVAMKTFKIGLMVTDFDELDYFKQREFEEGHLKSQGKPITSIQQWVSFVSKRRNKKRKADRFLLHTACQTCLSPHFEDSNPIITCPECHLRNHLLCLDLQVVQRCGRCIYSRLSKEIKKTTPQCFLCPNQHLTPIRIAFNLFAHVFCLFAHDVWDIRNGKITGTPIINISGQVQKCELCSEESKHPLPLCPCCEKNFHPMCAFLAGMDLQVGTESELEIRCSGKWEKVRGNRYYLLNYRQCVFKKLNQKKKRLCRSLRPGGK